MNEKDPLGFHRDIYSAENLQKLYPFNANSLKNPTLSSTHLSPKTLPSLVQAFETLPSLVQKLVKTVPLPSYRRRIPAYGSTPLEVTM